MCRIHNVGTRSMGSSYWKFSCFLFSKENTNKAKKKKLAKSTPTAASRAQLCIHPSPGGAGVSHTRASDARRERRANVSDTEEKNHADWIRTHTEHRSQEVTLREWYIIRSLSVPEPKWNEKHIYSFWECLLRAHLVPGPMLAVQGYKENKTGVSDVRCSLAKGRYGEHSKCSGGDVWFFILCSRWSLEDHQLRLEDHAEGA